MRRNTAAAAGGFAAEVGRGQQQVSIDSCCCRATCRPRNFGPTVKGSSLVTLFVVVSSMYVCAVDRAGPGGVWRGAVRSLATVTLAAVCAVDRAGPGGVRCVVPCLARRARLSDGVREQRA